MEATVSGVLARRDNRRRKREVDTFLGYDWLATNEAGGKLSQAVIEIVKSIYESWEGEHR